MQLVAINVSMVFRMVMPSDRNALKLLAAWTAMSPPTSSMIGSDVSSFLPRVDRLFPWHAILTNRPASMPSLVTNLSRPQTSAHVVDTPIVESGSLADASPHGVQVPEGFPRDISADDVGIVSGFGNHVEPCNSGAAQGCQDGIAVFGFSDVQGPVVPIDIRPLGDI
jgi:hypothetical protein